jgi:valyl-tRNA synthetase
MEAEYNPRNVESKWDEWWTSRGYYKPDENSDKETFVVVIPPPNVTGTLHLGHALTSAIQDCLVRWQRMRGKNTLYVPGTDHAGIATQVVVEKKLMREQNKTRHDLGRAAFLDEVWKWKEANGAQIVRQLKRLGISADWSREAFTMDERCSRAVTEAFVRMHETKCIYRANRIVSWSCALKTAISNIEVNHEEITQPQKRRVPGHPRDIDVGLLHIFAYKLEDGDDEICVATTRIETMLGDVAVVVHPDDERYVKFHGRKVVHPFQRQRRLPIICDALLVNQEFGTGAVKLTPGHDARDFECGLRHNLPVINILNDDGSINANGGMLQGLNRFHARERIISQLQEWKLYRGSQPTGMTIAICSRSGDIIEPVVRPQWWVNCEDMARKAVAKTQSGELVIRPEIWQTEWYSWLNNVRDWCISRQLWWGHRCPAYLVSIDGAEPKDEPENWVVARNEEEAMQKATLQFKMDAKRIRLQQDPDVLDTWFSSGLFPMSVMGWPDDTVDMQLFFPGTLLETGHDILFFWVARMVMMSLELTNKLPFKEVFLHAMIRDKFGQKMSKSSGNVIDPLCLIDGATLDDLHAQLRGGNLSAAEVERAIQVQSKEYPEGIECCGADALRFGLLAYTSHERNINLDVQRIVGYRRFANKVWNAVQFARGIQLNPNLIHDFLTQWITWRLDVCVHDTNQALANYDFHGATTSVYNFWLYDLCDVFIEMIKPARDKYSAILHHCIQTGLKLLHPMMPFVTEELYQQLQLHTGSIMIQNYPAIQIVPNFALKNNMDMLKKIAHAVRSTVAHLKIKPEAVCLPQHIVGHEHLVALLKTHVYVSQNSSGLQVSVDGKLSVFLQVSTYNIDGALQKLDHHAAQTASVMKKLKEKMQGSCYATKASEVVKQEHLQKCKDLTQRLAESQLIRFDLLACMESKNPQLWNEHLQNKTYVKGHFPTAADRTAFETMTPPNHKLFPHLARWWKQISAFSVYERSKW